MIGFFKSDSSLTDSFWKLIQTWMAFLISFYISFLILSVWFKSELYTTLEYISNLIHISFASHYTSDLSIDLMSAVVHFKSDSNLNVHIYYPVYEKIEWPRDLHCTWVPVWASLWAFRAGLWTKTQAFRAFGLFLCRFLRKQLPS